MAAFYHCTHCGREFLGDDNIPIEDDELEPVCDRCQYMYICGICGDSFQPLLHRTIDGILFTGSADYCPSCYAEEKTPLDEQIALSEQEVLR